MALIDRTANLVAAKSAAARLDSVDRVVATGTTPGLAVVLVGDDPASLLRADEGTGLREVGMRSINIRRPYDLKQAELDLIVDECNGYNSTVHGILVRFPLPAHLDKKSP